MNSNVAVAESAEYQRSNGRSSSSSSNDRNPLSTTTLGGALSVVGIEARYKWEWNNKCFANKKIPYLFLVIVCACHGPFLFGYSLSVLNTSISVIGGQFLWCDYEGYTTCHQFSVYAGWAQNGMLIGGAISCVLSGFLVNKLGCRKALLITDGLVTVGFILGCCSVNFTTLLISRLIIGCVGMFSVATPTYIAEVTPPRMRGPYQVVMQSLLQLGVFVGTLLGLPFSTSPSAMDGEVQPTPEQIDFQLSTFDKVWWRVMQGFPLIIVAMGVVSFALIYQHETPYYLVRHGHSSEAQAVLQRARRSSDVGQELQEIEQFTLKERAEVYKNRQAWKILFTNKHALHALAIGTFVSAVHQLGGISAFYTSSNSLFSEAGVAQDVVIIVTNVLTGISFIATLASIGLVEVLGRRPMLVAGAFVMGLSVLPGGIMLLVSEDGNATAWTAIAGSAVFVIAFSLTWGAVTWTYMFEIFPVELKDQAGGIMTSVNYLSAIVMIFAASLLPTHVVFITFSAVNIVAGVVVSIFLRETKGYIVGDSPYFPKAEKLAPEVDEAVAHSEL
eukprot:Lankesteria_metandrocarpae@DN2620_c0_g1_i1.p1